MPHLSPEKVLANYESKLGDEFGPALYFFEQSLWHSIATWDIWLSLFTSEKRIHLMGRHDSSFWATVQNALLDQAIMSACRMAENSSYGKNKNLSIRRIVETAGIGDDAETKKCLVRIADELPAAKRWRDKLLSHHDLPTATGHQETPSVNVQSITAIYKSVLRILNAVHIRYFESEISTLALGNIQANDVLELLYLYDREIKKSDWLNRTQPPPSWLFTSTEEDERYFDK
jgi:hypothetical protein